MSIIHEKHKALHKIWMLSLARNVCEKIVFMLQYKHLHVSRNWLGQIPQTSCAVHPTPESSIDSIFMVENVVCSTLCRRTLLEMRGTLQIVRPYWKVQFTLQSIVWIA